VEHFYQTGLSNEKEWQIFAQIDMIWEKEHNQRLSKMLQ